MKINIRQIQMFVLNLHFSLAILPNNSYLSDLFYSRQGVWGLVLCLLFECSQVQIPALLLSSHATVGKSFTVSEPLFSQLQHGNTTPLYGAVRVK